MVAVLVAGLGAAVPAQASDASLRKAVKAQERKADVAADDFAEARTDLESVVGREDARLAVVKFKSVVARLRASVAKERATTARVKRGRTQYLGAISRVLTALKTFDQGRIVVHLLVELYSRNVEEATEVLEDAARGQLTITSLAEEQRPPAAAGDDRH